MFFSMRTCQKSHTSTKERKKSKKMLLLSCVCSQNSGHIWQKMGIVFKWKRKEYSWRMFHSNASIWKGRKSQVAINLHYLTVVYFSIFYNCCSIRIYRFITYFLSVLIVRKAVIWKIDGFKSFFKYLVLSKKSFQFDVVE